MFYIGIVSSAEPSPLEKRAILDEGFQWLSPLKVDEVLSRIKYAGFNIFVPIVWHGRGASWNSKLVEEREPRWIGHARQVNDPLKVLIEKAHRLGIEVHPWFTVVLRQREFYSEFYNADTPKQAFNIHNDSYREFIIELMLEVVRNYDIDGVNLDYIRSMGNCLSVACVADYKSKTGRDLKADNKLQWDDHDSGFHISKWNESQITYIVKQFSERARAIKPELVISVDTHVNNRRLTLEGADSIKWANSGYIDVVYDMQYGDELDISSFEQAKVSLHDPSKLVLMLGNFQRSVINKSTVEPKQTGLFIDQVQKVLNIAGDSAAMAVYEYRYLEEEQVQALRAGPFSEYLDLREDELRKRAR